MYFARKCTNKHGLRSQGAGWGGENGDVRQMGSSPGLCGLAGVSGRDLSWSRNIHELPHVSNLFLIRPLLTSMLWAEVMNCPPL